MGNERRCQSYEGLLSCFGSWEPGRSECLDRPGTLGKAGLLLSCPLHAGTRDLWVCVFFLRAMGLLDKALRHSYHSAGLLCFTS